MSEKFNKKIASISPLTKGHLLPVSTSHLDYKCDQENLALPQLIWVCMGLKFGKGLYSHFQGCALQSTGICPKNYKSKKSAN